MVSYWALQGHALSQQLVPWQQNILAKAAFAISLAVAVITLVQPKLIYEASAREQSRQTVSSAMGVKNYFQARPQDVACVVGTINVQWLYCNH
jgi:xanthosine utilization system XapX-like protein